MRWHSIQRCRYWQSAPAATTAATSSRANCFYSTWRRARRCRYSNTSWAGRCSAWNGSTTRSYACSWRRRTTGRTKPRGSRATWRWYAGMTGAPLPPSRSNRRNWLVCGFPCHAGLPATRAQSRPAAVQRVVSLIAGRDARPRQAAVAAARRPDHPVNSSRSQSLYLFLARHARLVDAVGFHPSITPDRSIGPTKGPNRKIILGANRCTDLPQPRAQAGRGGDCSRISTALSVVASSTMVRVVVGGHWTSRILLRSKAKLARP
jgi:hypothetical protein